MLLYKSADLSLSYFSSLVSTNQRPLKHEITANQLMMKSGRDKAADLYGTVLHYYSLKGFKPLIVDQTNSDILPC